MRIRLFWLTLLLALVGGAGLMLLFVVALSPPRELDPIRPTPAVPSCPTAAVTPRVPGTGPVFNGAG